MKKHNTNIDIIRIVATLMIVMAHITTTVYERPDFFGGTAWWVSFIIITVSRLGVPLFFMISGYLLVHKKRTIQQSVVHAWHRLLIPSFIWSLFTYAGLYISQGIVTIPSWDMFFVGLGTAYYFLIGLSILYIVNPIIQKVATNLPQQSTQVVLLVLAISTAGETLYRFYTESTGVHIFTYWFMALFYFLYGQYATVYETKDAGERWGTLFWTAIAAMMLLIYGEKASGNWDVLLWESYFGPTVMVASVGLFRMIMQADFKVIAKKYGEMIKKMAGMCFVVYLSHGIILDLLLHKTSINPYGRVQINLMVFLAVITLLTLVISGVISFVLEGNKHTNALVGYTSKNT